MLHPDSMAQIKAQTFGPQNPCAAEEGDALHDCLAEQECIPAGGGEGIYMDVVVGGGTNRTPWGEPMCVPAAEAESGEEVVGLPTFTLQEFKTLNVTPAASVVQPAPDTLKGMHTNVYAEAGPSSSPPSSAASPCRSAPSPCGTPGTTATARHWAPPS